MPPDSIPEPWNSFFKEIEVSLRQRLDLHCLGGFVMTILYGLDRPTADVDVLPVGLHPAMDPVLALAGQESPLHRKYQIYLEVVGVASIPMNYEDRLREMFPGSFDNLHLFGLDPYDLALSKLERNAQRDRDDVKYLARKVPLDLKVLQERYEKELRPDLGNPRREDVTFKLWTEMIREDRETRSET